MSWKHLINRAGAAFTGLLFAGMTLMGCSGDLNPLNAPADENAFSVLELGEVDDPILATKPLIEKETISAAEGGEVVLKGSIRVKALHFAETEKEKKKAKNKKIDVKYEYRLTFPPGALDEDTEIQMRANKRGKVKLWLDPHGAQFNKPVELSITLGNKKISARKMKQVMDIYWLDEEAVDDDGDLGVWVPLGARVDDDGHSITFKVGLDHFSQYSLGGYGPIQKWYYQGWYVP